MFSMCRKKQAQGWCALCFGMGLMVGYYLESWFLCSTGGLGLILLGLYLTRK